ncbi:MAG: DUF2589 domain-containing protein [Pseudomonadota bacterium]|jgi:hypothetical protein
MPNLVQELNSLDFSVYIGGPLQAAVDAQHAASMSQVNFIKEVGFITTAANAAATPPVLASTDLRYVDFKYKKRVPNPNFGKLPAEAVPAGANVTNEFLDQEITIKVPFLTMLTIPALRIEEINIDFNAKLTSVETTAASSEFAGSAELSAKFWKVKFKASASYKRSTSSTTNVEKTYNLGVRVRAVNDELPAGLDRILTMLEDSIRVS